MYCVRETEKEQIWDGSTACEPEKGEFDLLFLYFIKVNYFLWSKFSIFLNYTFGFFLGGHMRS